MKCAAEQKLQTRSTETRRRVVIPLENSWDVRHVLTIIETYLLLSQIVLSIILATVYW